MKSDYEYRGYCVELNGFAGYAVITYEGWFVSLATNPRAFIDLDIDWFDKRRAREAVNKRRVL